MIRGFVDLLKNTCPTYSLHRAKLARRNQKNLMLFTVGAYLHIYIQAPVPVPLVSADTRDVRKIRNKPPPTTSEIYSRRFIISISFEKLSAERKRCRNGVGRKICFKSKLSPTPQDRLLDFDGPDIRHVMHHDSYFGVTGTEPG